MSKLRITWKKSAIGYRRDQGATIKSLGLRRLHQTVEREDTPVVRGMVLKVRHLVNVIELQDEPQDEPQPVRRRASQTKKTTLEEKPSEAALFTKDAVSEPEAIGDAVEEPTATVTPRKRSPRKKAPFANANQDTTTK